MTCQECELLLADGERTAAAGEHLRDCEECRMLAAEMTANAEAFLAMRHDAMPIRPRRRWMWAAAAAALVLGLGLTQLWRQPGTPVQTPPASSAKSAPLPPIPEEALSPSPAAQPARARATPPAPEPVKIASAEPMKVKMLTSDPDVVVYWLIEPGAKAGQGE